MLKALELSGFKSFAEKSRFEFPPGVTMVVGPNGSGKSNVVDAIRWVLGSQSAKALRGDGMTDVIFNGASGHRPLGSAEVTLTLDNRGRIFDLDADEVRVSRRVYRSGEGEYLINGQASRLRTIREMLSGAGVGNESYSIIEQGRVDALLQASPAERRALFEEAAGVSRLRGKRHEAARRLERVEQNLLRLSDIVDEVEGRLRRVRMQAGKARRYRDHADRLKRVRCEIAVADWRAATDRLAEIQRHSGDGQTDEQAASNRLSHAEQTLAEIDRALSVVDRDEQAAAEGQQEVAERLARELGLHAAATVRLSELQLELHAQRAALVEHRQAPAALDEATRDAIGQLEACESALPALESVAHTSEASLASLRRQLADVSADRTRLQENVDSLHASRRECDHQIEVLRLQAAKNAEVAQQRSLAIRSVESDFQRWSAELLHAEQELQELQAQRATEEQVAGADAQAVANVERQLSETQGLVEQANKRLWSLELQAEAASREESERAAVLSALQNCGEQSSPTFEVLGTVGELIVADVDLADMLNAALGPRSRYWVATADPGSPRQLPALGPIALRATLIWADGPGSGSATIDLSDEPGVMGRADGFAAADPSLSGLVGRLLGHVWYVDTLQTAERLAPIAGRGAVFVTHRSEVLDSDGSLTLGPPPAVPADGGPEQTVERLKALAVVEEEAVTAAKSAANSLTNRLTALRRAAVESAANSERIVRRVRELEQLVASHRPKIEGLARRRESVEAALAQLENEQRTQLAQVAERQRRLEELVEQIGVAEGLVAEADSAESRLQLRVSAAVTLAEHSRQRLAAALQAVAALRGVASRARDDAANRTRSSNTLGAALERTKSELERTELQALAVGARIATLTQQRDQRGRLRKRLVATRLEAQDRRRKMNEQVETIRKHLEQARARRSRSDIQLARLQEERSALVKRMRDDYEIDLPRLARETPVASGPPIDRDSLEQEMAGLRQQLQALGMVNVESLNELDELESRFARLSAQYADLSAARTSLRNVSSKIGRDSQQLFLATVEAARGEFRDVFRKLFGGGEADIVLIEEGDDPSSDKNAEPGVDIVACPPGKELRSLSLLSGGEKTLTCLALLLALFRLRPSPFCVLDEVDAALDEANIQRLTRALEEFRSGTQFIVITHSKKTMTVADTLYGVTMQQSGVSKLVSVRFEDVDDQGNVRPSRADERRLAA
ncbi:Chromosome partition protein Smc [Pirellulimonas nuda]|uniref:Chromosome partition protein Smc n=1 Tax=Pirellulimonas nuda TaxID=2528009 RepID=A0A518DGL9_9BACT|nr:chromosome segregation protein SMC [Pirellulimonas nuda]QDU90582.1 Chromosome partition protein Smc [Pirellulimonas nuda]